MSLFSNRNHLQEAKKGPCQSTKPSFKSSWYFKHSMRYFPPMNAEMLVHGEMLATPIIKPSWMGGRIFWFSTAVCYFSMFIISLVIPVVTGDTNIYTANYLRKRKVLWLLRLLRLGIYLFIRLVGRFFASLSSYQVSTRSRTDFKALMYARRRQKFRGDFYKRKPVSLLQAADSTVSPACFSEWIISFPVTSCSEEVYHETSIMNSHSEQQHSFDMCRHASDFSLSS